MSAVTSIAWHVRLAQYYINPSEQKSDPVKESGISASKDKKIKVEVSDILHSKKKNNPDALSLPMKPTVKAEIKKSEKGLMPDPFLKHIKQEPMRDHSKANSKVTSGHKTDSPKKLEIKHGSSCRESIGSGSTPRKKLDSNHSNKSITTSPHKIVKTNHIHKEIKKEFPLNVQESTNEPKSGDIHKTKSSDKISLSEEKKNGTLTVKSKSQSKIDENDMKKVKTKEKRKHQEDADPNPKKYAKIVLLSQVPSSTLSPHNKNNIPKIKNSGERRSKSRHHFSREAQQDLESAVVDCVACLVNTVRDQIEDMLTKQKSMSSEAIRVRTASPPKTANSSTTDLSEPQTRSSLPADSCVLQVCSKNNFGQEVNPSDNLLK